MNRNNQGLGCFPDGCMPPCMTALPCRTPGAEARGVSKANVCSTPARSKGAAVQSDCKVNGCPIPVRKAGFDHLGECGQNDCPTPIRDAADPHYESMKALCRGTLFTALDLPLRNNVNAGVPDTPQTELMARDFAAHDLSLYLDTHPDDQEAFALYQKLLRIAEDTSEQTRQHLGAVCKKDLLYTDRYSWLQDPWPWDKDCREG